jgi:hypothetical protein
VPSTWGCFRRCREGIKPDAVVGTSVGALNGALLVGHLGLPGVLELATLWDSLHRQDILAVRARSLLPGVFGHHQFLFWSVGLRSLLLRRPLGPRETRGRAHSSLRGGDGPLCGTGSGVERTRWYSTTPSQFRAFLGWPISLPSSGHLQRSQRGSSCAACPPDGVAPAASTAEADASCAFRPPALPIVAKPSARPRSSPAPAEAPACDAGRQQRTGSRPRWLGGSRNEPQRWAGSVSSPPTGPASVP